MSSSTATTGACHGYLSEEEGAIQRGAEHADRGYHQNDNDNIINRAQQLAATPIGTRRGGLSSPTDYSLQQQHSQQQQRQEQQNLYEQDEMMSAATASCRDKNLDSFVADSFILSSHYQPNVSSPIRDDNDSSPSNPGVITTTPHPPLQIRFTPHSRQGSVVSHSRAHSRQGSVTGLQIRTDIPSASSRTTTTTAAAAATAIAATSHDTNTQLVQSSIPSGWHNLDSASSIPSSTLTPTGNLRKAISNASLSSSYSPGGLASPALAAMLDITPLPSPIMPGELSPVPWKRICNNENERPSVLGAESGLSSSPPRFSMPMSPASPPKKKKHFESLLPVAVEAQAISAESIANAAAHEQNQINHQKNRAVSHGRNRSISDFVPEQLHNIRPNRARHVTVNLSSTPSPQYDIPMHREQYLAAQRGLINQPTATTSLRLLPDPTKALPSPPPSNKSVSSEMDEDDDSFALREYDDDDDDADVEYFKVQDTHEPLKKRKWRAVRELGHGTFSKVKLATSERLPSGTPYTQDHLNPSKLVAIKVVEHGPAGGADEERMGVSLKREVDILKSVRHPCIVQLKAMEYTEDRALLVITFCPGGDLFDLASQRKDVLNKNLVQRIFAELVAAVRYLHEMGVVHRDLKLENVLVLPTPDFLKSLTSPQTYPHPLIQLTDLGLSRRIPPPPASPLLSTRCGSEDYAAPEILLGQPYDGRATDAWALGVLLYALMEGRLPFDCPPGKPERSRVSHRVARCDWIWTRFGDEDGEWDSSLAGADEWRGAGEVVEGLLKKVRMGRKPLQEVEQMEWVQEGIKVEGGLKRVDDKAGEV